MAGAFLNVSVAHGYNVRGDPWNASDAMAHVLGHMSRADQQALFAQPMTLMDFLHEHLNYALQVRGGRALRNVTYEMWREYVLPFGFLDEKRDLFWRWRPIFHRAFAKDPALLAANTTTQAVHALTALIPKAAMQGVLSVNDTLVPGDTVRWHSGTSPFYMSVQQIVQNGGSCTGTAIVLGAVLRAVGIPARVAGCSTEAPANTDDHHWVEFFDSSDPGPFGDFWHTKEGVSAGNARGPWDAPSGPMNGCLRGVVAHSQLDSMWASSWSSPVFLPTLWGADRWSRANRWKGGINRCGAYCTAWGCGVNQSQKFAQASCAPPLSAA